MRFSKVAAIGALVGLSSATSHTITKDVEVEVVCTDGAATTVTEYVTVTAGAAGVAGGAPQGTVAPYVPPPYITTSGGSVSSCDYSGSRTTVYIYPTSEAKWASRDVTVVVYERVKVVTAEVINIHVTVENGETQTVTVTKTDAPTYTYAPPPPPQSTTSSATGSHATHFVTVGDEGKLIYGPNQVIAAVGDVIKFNFLKLSHSLTESSFEEPCTFNGGFDTGLNQFNPQNISGKFIVDYTVQTTKPTWFYCKQTGHCGKGMVFAVNPGNKFDAFHDKALAFGNNTVPASKGAPMIKGRQTFQWRA